MGKNISDDLNIEWKSQLYKNIKQQDKEYSADLQEKKDYSYKSLNVGFIKGYIYQKKSVETISEGVVYFILPFDQNR